MERLTEKTQIFRDYGEEYWLKDFTNCRATCRKTEECEGCIVNNALIKLGKIEDRQVNLKDRLTIPNADFEYIVKSMDAYYVYKGCEEICEDNKGDCHKCDINKAIQKLGQYEDMEEGNE